MKPKPRRMFKQNPMPTIPAGADQLRDARKAVDPFRTYRMRMPDGEVMEVDGADLIRDVDAMVALVDAQRAGDEAGIRRALERIEALA